MARAGSVLTKPKELTPAQVARRLKARGLKAASPAELEALTRMMNEDLARERSETANERFFAGIQSPVLRERAEAQKQLRTGRATKLTDRELSEAWTAQKRSGELNPAWDGDGWKVLTKRKQAAFAKAEQAKAQTAIDFIRRSYVVTGRTAGRQKR